MASNRYSQIPPTHLASILTAGNKHHPGEVWRTSEGNWRSMNRGGETKSFATKDEANTHARGKKDKHPAHGHGEHEEHDEPGVKEVFTKFMSKLKGAPAASVDFVKNAPSNVKKFVVDKDHRKGVMSSASKSMAESAKKIPELLKKATKEEYEEIKTGVGAVKKLFKKPPEKLTKHDKKALYAVGAYVASTAVAAATGGAALAAGGFGKAFLKHVGMKAVHHLLDNGFTHFEVAEAGAHGLHTLMHHLASTEDQTFLRLAGDGDETEMSEAVLAYVHAAVQDVMEKGLSDDDMAEVVKSIGGEGDSEEKSEKSASTLRGRLVRLASKDKDLRPHLLQLLK